jgi:hypothetical protein
MWVHPTVTASTMIAQVCWTHKVRCHMGVVEIFGSEAVESNGVLAHRSYNRAVGSIAPTLAKNARMGHPAPAPLPRSPRPLPASARTARLLIR